MSAIQLMLIPGVEASPAPWTIRDDGTILAADGRPVCVLGDPFAAFSEQDVTNGALLLAAPALLAAAKLGRAAIAEARELLIEGATVPLAVTLEPDLSTLDEIARQPLAELDAQLLQVDAALALAGGKP